MSPPNPGQPFRGRFISIEGGEGVGKSTQIAALAEALRADNIDVIITREPGGTEGAEAIRSLLLNGRADRWNARSEALLFAAARADHVDQLIRPALDMGKWIISDRFLDSSRAYQGQGGETDALRDEDIMAMHQLGSQGLLPDRTLVLTLDSDAASKRAEQRDSGLSDRIQARSADYHAAVHAAFERFAAEDPDRVRLIDAKGSPDRVTKRLLDEIADLLP